MPTKVFEDKKDALGDNSDLGRVKQDVFRT